MSILCAKQTFFALNSGSMVSKTAKSESQNVIFASIVIKKYDKWHKILLILIAKNSGAIQIISSVIS